MNRKREAIIVANLSPRAKKLWERIVKGQWYGAHAANLPKAIKELTAAGLVKHAPKAVVIAKGIVPHDFKASYKETWQGKERKIL